MNYRPLLIIVKPQITVVLRALFTWCNSKTDNDFTYLFYVTGPTDNMKCHEDDGSIDNLSQPSPSVLSMAHNLSRKDRNHFQITGVKIKINLKKISVKQIDYKYYYYKNIISRKQLSIKNRIYSISLSLELRQRVHYSYI